MRAGEAALLPACANIIVCRPGVAVRLMVSVIELRHHSGNQEKLEFVPWLTFHFEIGRAATSGHRLGGAERNLIAQARRASIFFFE